MLYITTPILFVMHCAICNILYYLQCLTLSALPVLFLMLCNALQCLAIPCNALRYLWCPTLPIVPYIILLILLYLCCLQCLILPIVSSIICSLLKCLALLHLDCYICNALYCYTYNTYSAMFCTITPGLQYLQYLILLYLHCF